MSNTSNDTIANEIRAAEMRVRDLSDQLADAKDELRALRGQVAKARKSPRACECGCGGVTSGGMFLPGHDAKMRSALIRLIRDGGDDATERAALAQLAEYPNLMHGIGDWDLGRDRKARAAKEQRASQTAQDKAARQAADQQARAQRDALTARSRTEQNATAEQIAAQKKRAIADAKAAGTITVPSNPSK